MIQPWQGDKDWADRYLPAAKEVIKRMTVGLISVSPADSYLDEQQATDLVVEAGQLKHWAWRVRASKWCSADGVTVRFSRPTGTTTEFEKILSGLGDAMLYAWTAAGKDGFDEWVALDLDKYRQAFLDLRLPRPERKFNDDGTSFLVYPVAPLVDLGVIFECELAQAVLL